MPPYQIQATEKSPSVLFDPDKGILEVRGRSVHENAAGFYEEIFRLIDGYGRSPGKRMDVRIALDYFNSSSAKFLLDILKQLDDLHASGTTKVSLEWSYEEGDLDMQEAGNDYKALLEMPVKVRAR